MKRVALPISTLALASCALVGGIEPVDYGRLDGGGTTSTDGGGVELPPGDRDASVPPLEDGTAPIPPADAAVDVETIDAAPLACQAPSFCDSFEHPWVAATLGWGITETGGGNLMPYSANVVFPAYHARYSLMSSLPRGSSNATALAERSLGSWTRIHVQVAIRILFLRRAARLFRVSLGVERYVSVITDGASLSLTVVDAPGADPVYVVVAGPQPQSEYLLYDLDILSNGATLGVQGRTPVSFSRDPLSGSARLLVGLFTDRAASGTDGDSKAQYDALRVTVE